MCSIAIARIRIMCKIILGNGVVPIRYGSRYPIQNVELYPGDQPNPVTDAGNEPSNLDNLNIV